MATAALRAPSPTWLWHARKTARNAFTACRHRFSSERNAYYDILEETQKGTLDITSWMEWFLGCLGRAIDGAQTILGSVLAKAASGKHRRDRAQRTPAPRAESPARWLRGQAHDNEIRQARQVFPGHGPPRHRASRRTRNSCPQPGRGAEHELRSYEYFSERKRRPYLKQS